MNPGPVYTLMAVFTLGNKIYDTQRCRDDDEYSLFFPLEMSGVKLARKNSPTMFVKTQVSKTG